MIITPRPDELVEILRTDFPSRNEPQLAWQSACSAFQILPGLVGFWPMGSVRRSTGDAYDMSEQGRTLTYAGNPVYNFTSHGVPYIDFDGVGDWLTRPDETDLDVLGTEAIYAAAARGLTMGGWFYIDVYTAFSRVMTKWDAGTNNRAYQILLDSVVNARFYCGVSTDGIAQVLCQPTAGTAVIGQWYFVVARFTPSTELAMFVNGTKYTVVAGIPASIFNSNAALVIGSDAVGSTPFDGRASMCFLCANALPDALLGMLYQQTRSMFGV